MHTKQQKRLQAYAGMAAAILATAPVAAQINHIDVDPDIELEAATYDLDLNGDGITDYQLVNNYGSTFSNWNSIRPMGSNEVAGFGSGGGVWGGTYLVASQLAYGDVIDGALNWLNEDVFFNFKSVSYPFLGQWDDESGIAALRFQVAGNWHFGFIRVYARTGFISGKMEVLNYSWNSNPGGPIVATDFGLCAAPTGLTATQLTPTKFELSWDVATTVNKYQVFYRKVGEPSILKKKLTPYNMRVVSGLDPATAYEWTVRVRCPLNETSAIAGAYGFTTPAPRLVPGEEPRKTVRIQDKPNNMKSKE